MPRKRRTSTPDLVGMTPKQMKRRKPINNSTFVSVEPKIGRASCRERV